MWWLVLLAQLPPAAPTPVYPPDGGVRIIYDALEVSAPPAGLTRSFFELRREDAGWGCPDAGGCPPPRTSPPFERLSPNVSDGRWCFRARYENDAGSSPWSQDACFLEDRTPPPAPFYVDAGFADGFLVIEYAAAPEPGPEAAGIARFCAGAIEQSTADRYGPFCQSGSPWRAEGSVLSAVLRLPVGPGEWRAGVAAVDFADNGSALADGGPVITVVEQGPAPAPPYWRLPDGGRGADDLWTNDTYLTRITYPGTATMRYSVRFLMVKEPQLLRKVERRLVEAVFRWQRHRAKVLGATGRQVGGAVTFLQLFGSALQLQPHLHGLVAEGLWSDGIFMELPPPSPEEVEAVLERALAQLLPDSSPAGWCGQRTSTRRSRRSRRSCVCRSTRSPLLHGKAGSRC